MEKGGKSQTQTDLEEKEARQEARLKQQNLELQKKQLKTLRGRASGFASASPTSLLPGTNGTNGAGTKTTIG